MGYIDYYSYPRYANLISNHLLADTSRALYTLRDSLLSLGLYSWYELPSHSQILNFPTCDDDDDDTTIVIGDVLSVLMVSGLIWVLTSDTLISSSIYASGRTFKITQM